MYITQIELENFRGFIKETIDFNERFTVLMGENGTGKTAILEALSVALGGYLSGLDGIESRNIRSDEVRLQNYLSGDVITTEPIYPVRVSCKAIVDNRTINWSRAVNGARGHTTRIEARGIIEFAQKLQSHIRKGENLTLPVLGYFGTGRLWAQKKAKSKNDLGLHSRFLGYTDCLDPISTLKLFTNWFKRMTQIKLQKGKNISGLTVVQRAVEQCLESLSDNRESVSIYYDLELEEIIVQMQNGSQLPLSMLSDGYRNTLCMVADIAYRMSVLNPHLLDSASIDTPGIILIDEIDLHLHPRWQKAIVSDLKRTFPLIQFIVTTHSPIVISSCHENEVVKLSKIDMNTKIEYIKNTKGWLAEDIISEFMGLDTSRDEETEQKIKVVRELYYKKLTGSLTDDEANTLKTFINSLSSNLPESDPIITLIKLEAIEEKILGRKGNA